MEDKYFENQLIKLIGLFNLGQPTRDEVRTVLKEVAKDQRHACAEAVLKVEEDLSLGIVSRCSSAAMNAYLE